MLNNISISTIGAIILAIMVGGGIYIWKRSVENQSVIEYVKNQQEQIIKDQKKMINDLTAINKNGIEIITKLKDKQIDLNKKLQNLESYLSTHKDTKQSSEVLKRTIKELSQ